MWLRLSSGYDHTTPTATGIVSGTGTGSGTETGMVSAAIWIYLEQKTGS